MKRILSILLSFLLLFSINGISNRAAADEYLLTLPDDFDEQFSSLNDPAFLQYVEDSVYVALESQFVDDPMILSVDSVNAVFISKEYLEEIAYNTKANVFFGYTLAQIDEVFEGTKHVFTLSEDGQTVVQEYIEIPDDTYDRVLKNVIIGAGVILVCVAVTIATAGATAPVAAGASTSSIAGMMTATTATKATMIFAASAKTATDFALGGAALAAASTVCIRGYETGWDMDAVLESAAVNASEKFKWGAITGAIVGGAEEALYIHHVSKGPLTPRQAEDEAYKLLGGRTQVTYLNGEEVPYGTLGGTRPDVVCGNVAYEVKCYNLSKTANLNELGNVLVKQLSYRSANLPAGMSQAVILNVEGRGFTEMGVAKAIKQLQQMLDPVCPNVTFYVMGDML